MQLEYVWYGIDMSFNGEKNDDTKKKQTSKDCVKKMFTTGDAL